MTHPHDVLQHDILPLETVDTTSTDIEVVAEEPRAIRSDVGVTPESAEAAQRSNAPPGQVLEGATTPPGQVLDNWKAIQGKFVDDPRGSVADARALVDDLIQHVVRSVTERRESLDRQWSSEPSVSTEQLRLCLQQYRALFTHLLPVVPATTVAETSAKR
ncbi:MAG TPA: hypothetical protein VFU02_21435 [Polyangiaceae bacterium]|nr:hypothetical protein [Polyangiaceae bacterium]